MKWDTPPIEVPPTTSNPATAQVLGGQPHLGGRGVVPYGVGGLLGGVGD